MAILRVIETFLGADGHITTKNDTFCTADCNIAYKIRKVCGADISWWPPLCSKMHTDKANKN